MENEYKIVLSNGKFYEELFVNKTSKPIYIGTMDGCDVLLDRDIYAPFCVLIYLNPQGSWEIDCDDNVYIADEGIIKQVTRLLTHGDDFEIKYNLNNKTALKLSFVINFEQEKQDFRRVIEIDDYSKSKILVGGTENYDICLNDELMLDSEFALLFEEGSLYVDNIRCRYGLYVNGNIVKTRTQIHDCDFISVLGCSFYYKQGTLRTTENGKITIHGLPCYTEQISVGNMLYPMFYRNTRVVTQPNKTPIHILAPPNALAKPERNILKRILPALGTLALTIVIRGIIGGGGTFVIFSVCTMSMGIGTSIASFVGERKAYKKGTREREEKYYKYLEKKRIEIEKAREKEKEYLEKTYLSSQQEYKLVEDFSSSLFGCKKGDFDYLNIRLGTGKIESGRPIEYKEVEQLEIEDPLTVLPEQMAEEYRYLEEVPIVCNLENVNALGIVGNDFHMQDLVKNITIDLCTRHYHTDVKIILIADEEKADYIRWARFLSHLNEENFRYLVCNEESRNTVFEFMFKVLSEREEEKTFASNYVVLVLDEMGIKSHPISRYISNAGQYGFSFIFFEEHEDRLPIGCTKIVRLLNNKRSGTLIDVNNGSNVLEFEYSTLNDEQVKEIALKLSPVYTEEVSLENSLIRNITLFELLEINNVKKLNLGERWNASMTEKTLAAPLGVNSKKEVVYLDLHEKFHGPHGLVAGTTGSGKSEILQSYILSMATLYHPHEVSFMIIDFKGGGMVNQFKNLPHLIGAITNIDGKEIDRSLKSIKAELKKRQRCFADAEVNHIDAYIGKYKRGEVREIIPHLIVIVDEFAELKAEQPEFMKELISAARIGRSLGVHLILATQKPAGQVNEQIWSNSKFKLCLKVQNKEDSNEVLKSPLAAEIKEPGRAYLQVGNNEIFELFQSAYSGAPAEQNAQADKKEFQIARVELSGKREGIYQYKKEKTEGEITSQLKAIVDYVAEYCAQMGIERAPSICLPPLPERQEYEQDYTVQGEFSVPIGIYDDPDSQYQGIAYLNVASGNTMIIGSSQNGKTNLLQLIVRHLSSIYTPDEFTFYVMDFASRVMVNFQELNHCGGVVCAGEDEKLKNLFKLLWMQIELRKDKLLQVGVTAYSSYREAGYKDLPLVLLLIDNLTALKELYLNDNDQLLTICREGSSLGICVVVANAVTSGFGYKYMSNFSERIALYCNDQAEYSSLFEFCRERPSQLPGRCILEKNKNKYECQTYIAFGGEKEMDRVNEMKKFISDTNHVNQGKHALRIPLIPKLLTRDMMCEIAGREKDIYEFPIGLEYSDVSPFYINLQEVGSLGISGRSKSGKTNFLKNLIAYADENPEKFSLYVVDGIDMRLRELCSEKSYIQYTYVPEQAAGFLCEIRDALESRYNLLLSGMQEELETAPLLLFINRSMDAIQAISGDKELMAIYKDILGKYKNLKVAVVHANIPNAASQYNGPEVLKMLKDAKHYLFFDNIGALKLADFSLNVTKPFRKPIEAGDAYVIWDINLYKIKTVLNQG